MHNVNLKYSYIGVSSGGKRGERAFANLTLQSCLCMLSCGCWLHFVCAHLCVVSGVFLLVCFFVFWF